MNYYLGTPGFPHGMAVKNLPKKKKKNHLPMQETRDEVSISESDDPLKEMVNHSSILA